MMNLKDIMAHMSNNVWIYGTLAIVVAGFLAWLRCRTGREKMKEEGEKEAKRENEDVSSVKAAGNVSADPVVVGLVRTRLKSLSGNFNGLYGVCNGNDFDADIVQMTFDNVAQTTSVHYEGEAKEWFATFFTDMKSWDEPTCKAKAEELLVLLKACGLKNGSEKTMVWSEECRQRFIPLSEMSDGDECEVFAPYWMYGIEVLEKGFVKK